MVSQSLRTSLVLGNVFVHDEDGFQNIRLVRFDDMTIHDHLVQNKVCAIKVEHDLWMNETTYRDMRSYTDKTTKIQRYHHLETYIKFTNILEVLIKSFNKGMNEFKDGKLVGITINSHDEKEGGIATIDTFVVLILDKGTLRLHTSKTLADNLTF